VNSANPQNYWKNRSAGWMEGTTPGKATDDTFDRLLIEAAIIAPGNNVLDLAAGTGDPTISIADHLGNTGSVTAFDMAEDMLAVATKRAESLGFNNVQTRIGDMEDLPFADDNFDAVTCRNGLMFPENKFACAAEARRVLKPGARAAWLVWATYDENPTCGAVRAGLSEYFGEDFPPRMVRHILGKEGALRKLLGEAGFETIEERRVSYRRVVKSGDDYFRRAAARTIPHRTGVLDEQGWKTLVACIEKAASALRLGGAFDIPVVARFGIGVK